MAVLDLFVLRLPATAKISSWFNAMLVTRELTSTVTKKDPSGICPSSLSQLMKCCVSLS